VPTQQILRFRRVVEHDEGAVGAEVVIHQLGPALLVHIQDAAPVRRHPRLFSRLRLGEDPERAVGRDEPESPASLKDDGAIVAPRYAASPNGIVGNERQRSAAPERRLAQHAVGLVRDPLAVG
jgi:hypothetical protein